MEKKKRSVLSLVLGFIAISCISGFVFVLAHAQETVQQVGEKITGKSVILTIFGVLGVVCGGFADYLYSRD